MDNQFKKFVFVLYVLIGVFSANVMGEDLTVNGRFSVSQVFGHDVSYFEIYHKRSPDSLIMNSYWKSDGGKLTQVPIYIKPKLTVENTLTANTITTGNGGAIYQDGSMVAIDLFRLFSQYKPVSNMSGTGKLNLEPLLSVEAKFGPDTFTHWQIMSAKPQSPNLYPINIQASEYNFERGPMTVDSFLICKNTVTASRLKIFNKMGTPMVDLTEEGDMAAIGLLLQSGSANTNSTYYGPSFSIKCNDYNQWDILATKKELGALDTVNVNLTADTLKVSSDMVVGGTITCKDQLKIFNKMGTPMVDLNEEGNMAAISLLLQSGSANTNSTYYGPSFSIKCNDYNQWDILATKKRLGALDTVNVNLTADTLKVSSDMVVGGTITCKDRLKVVEVKTDNLRAKNVTVDMGDAADYVFDENYDLKSLGEVEAYVKANKHLPGIPSASQMKEEGMNVSEMSNLLLEKIEELTLHLIRVEKENQALKAKVEALEK